MTASPLHDLVTQIHSASPVLAAWIGTPAPALIETLMGQGFDAAVLDMQHGGFDDTSAAAGIASCALLGRPALVRVPVGNFASASRLLDAGAAGIIAPMINSSADARALAAFTKFPPLGERSWGPRRVTRLAGCEGQAYLDAANRLHLTIAMIETREALAALDDILAVPGVDGVFVGPSDLSIALSQGGAVNPGSAEVDGALDHIHERATAAGKFAGLFCFTGTSAKAFGRRGFALTSISTDLLLLAAAARREVSESRDSH